MKKLFLIVAIAALAFSFTAPTNAVAATKKEQSITTAGAGTKQPRKHRYGSGMRARGGAGCKMSGSC